MQLSRILFAAVGVLVSAGSLQPVRASPGAEACCYALEDQVAELENKTVRNEIRNLRLRLSGQVNAMLMIWNDRAERDVYVVDNTESSTRFKLNGTTRINADWSATFLLEIEVEAARSGSVDQKTDGAPNENSDGRLDGRIMALSLGNARYGRLWIGRYSPATDNLITWGNRVANNPVANATPNRGEGLFLRLPEGTNGCTGSACLLNQTWSQFMSSQDTRRGHVLRYDTPSLVGFVLSAAWGEDDLADVALRWRKTFNSVDATFGIGHLRDTDEDEDTNMAPCPAATGGGAFCRQRRFGLRRTVGSFGIRHTPSGLYVVGAAARDRNDELSSPKGLFTGAARQDRGRMAYLQGGTRRRFSSLGNTTLYGEYQLFQDFSLHRNIAFGTGGQFEVVASDVNVWGMGLVQDIDASSLQLFAGFRHATADIDVLQSIAATPTDIPLQTVWTLSIGGKMKF